MFPTAAFCWQTLLLLLLVRCSTEGQCSTSSEGQRCEAGADAQVAELSVVLVAGDSVRWQLASVLPKRAAGKYSRSQSPVVDASIIHLRDPDVAQLVVLRTIDRKTLCFSKKGDIVLDSLGPVEDGKIPGIAAISNLVSNGSVLLATGHQGGVASVWTLDGIQTPWQRTALVKVAHHDWESVNRVVLSDDGQLLLACTEDNVLLSLLSPNRQEPQELHHLHGHDGQVAAASIALLPGGRYLAVVALRAGSIEGWTVDVTDKPEVQVAWRLQRSKKPLVSHLHVAASATSAAADSGIPAMLAVGDSEGTCSTWPLASDGSLDVPDKESPLWEQQPQSPRLQGMPVSGLRLVFGSPGKLGLHTTDKETWLVAVAVEQEVSVLQGATGALLHKGTFRSSTVMALSWE
eukprot:TRINITY_DN48681_c0_g1_i1.p1 TRINITY_DN48681_c0_g1~~TRINITY_DN48681_c0_g1_i1.p1  ORF type:complete len:413 (-),score=101.03 TRINITY_DN48681_c0_g1_i1:8-1219(-)